MMCRKNNKRNSYKVDGRHLLKSRTEKIRTGIYVNLGLYAAGS